MRNLDNIWKELQKGKLSKEEGFTAKEYSKHFDVSSTTANKKIRALVDAGIAKYGGQRKVIRIDGGLSSIPYYKLIEKTKK